MWLNSFRNGVKKGFLNKDKNFIRRWPVDPKVVFYGPPNVFQDEITQRLVNMDILSYISLQYFRGSDSF